MDDENIKKLYQKIVSSINYDDLTYQNNEGEWFSAVSVQIKAVNRYVENFKNANPYSIILSWNNEVYNYLKSNNPYTIGIRGNIVTAVFRSPKKSDIDNVIYYAAYICSLMDLFNAILEKKNMKTFNIGIGITTSPSRIDGLNDSKDTLFYDSVDLKSIVLSLNASRDGLDRILIDDCTQFNLSELICFGDKKYSEIGIKRNNLHFVTEDVYGYNLNLTKFTEWISKNIKKTNK